jgi:hypothetical protein
LSTVCFGEFSAFLGPTLFKDLKALVGVLAMLQNAGVMSGDNSDKNIYFDKDAVVFSNFGEVAEDYVNDVVATWNLLKIRFLGNLHGRRRNGR